MERRTSCSRITWSPAMAFRTTSIQTSASSTEVGLEDSKIEDVVVARNRVVGSSLRSYAVAPPQQRLWLLDNTSDQPAEGPVMTMHHLDGLHHRGKHAAVGLGWAGREFRDSTDVVYLPEPVPQRVGSNVPRRSS